ncbi:MAG: outer membrane lipoprotein carrier protein [Patiriisocius sp.]|jgi:outer membrane lipoprotein carrier protein
MIKRPILCLLFLLSTLSFSVSSQVTGAGSDAPVKSVKEISNLSKQVATDLASKIGSEQDKANLRQLLGQFSTLKANFTQTIIDMQGEELQNANGELLLKKPQKLRWSVLSPDESLLIADGTAVYNVDPFLEQVTILDQAPLTQSNPLMLLISDQQSQWDQVVVQQQESTYTIVSLQSDSPINKLVLRFNSNNELINLVSYDRQQQQNMLDFSNVVLNTGVSNKDFIFTANTSWVVDDQREIPTQ